MALVGIVRRTTKLIEGGLQANRPIMLLLLPSAFFLRF